MQIPEDRFRAVVFEALRRDFGGRWLGLTQAVAWVAIERGIYPAPNDTRIVGIEPADKPRLERYVRQLVDEGIVAPAAGDGHDAWRFLSLTELGREVVARGDHSAFPHPRAG